MSARIQPLFVAITYHVQNLVTNRQLSPYDEMVLGRIIRMMQITTGDYAASSAPVSLRALAHNFGLDQDSVRASVQRLVAAEALQVEPHPGYESIITLTMPAVHSRLSSSKPQAPASTTASKTQINALPLPLDPPDTFDVEQQQLHTGEQLFDQLHPDDQAEQIAAECKTLLMSEKAPVYRRWEDTVLIEHARQQICKRIGREEQFKRVQEVEKRTG